MKNLRIERVEFRYTDESGSFKNIPRRNDKIQTSLGELSVWTAEAVTRFTDGGASPFEVKIICNLPYNHELNS